MLARQCSIGRYSPAIAAREGDHEPVPYKHNVLAACDLRLTPACVTFCVSTPERGKRRRDRSPSSSSSSSVDSSSGDSSDNSSDSEADRKHKKHKTKKDKHKKHKTKKDKKKKDKKSKKDTKKKKVIVLDWAFFCHPLDLSCPRCALPPPNLLQARCMIMRHFETAPLLWDWGLAVR